MLYTSPNLCTAHFYKEDFLKILDYQDKQSARKAMSDLINSAYDCGIPRFVKCAKTMQNWLTGILDSFTTPLTNGFIEGCNNKIKVLKKMRMVTEISTASATAFYICSHSNQQKTIQNKRQLKQPPLVNFNYSVLMLPQLGSNQ